MGTPPPAGPRRDRDSVDAILDDWARERPDLDFGPVGVVTRLARVRAHLDAALVSGFARYELSPADFQVIVTLRRAGAPYRLPQARLVALLGLTPGTVSVRIDRLVRRGVVVREPAPDDARVVLIRLTDDGLRLFDEIAPVHLDNEDRLLSALDDDERDTLAGLLRRLLLSFENATVEAAQPLGLRLEQAHVSRARRVAVGLSDTPGLLVSDVVAGTPAAAAGLVRGDLLVAVDDQPIRDEPALAAALAGGRRTYLRIRVLRGDRPVTVTLRVPRRRPS